MINHPNRSKRSKHPVDAAREAAMSLISQIADRAVYLYAECDVRVNRMDIIMDLMACHFKGGNKLRLEDLLAADNFNFMHDVGGINRNLNRETYALENCFSPRFSQRAA